MKRKRTEIDECYTCKKAEICPLLEGIKERLNNVPRSFRRNGQILVTECDDYEPCEEAEEIKRQWSR